MKRPDPYESILFPNGWRGGVGKKLITGIHKNIIITIITSCHLLTSKVYICIPVAALILVK